MENRCGHKSEKSYYHIKNDQYVSEFQYCYVIDVVIV